MTSPKHTEAPSRIELPEDYSVELRSNVWWLCAGGIGVAALKHSETDYLLAFAAAMNHALQPACNCGKGKPVCTCTAAQPVTPGVSAKEAARELIEQIGDPEESYDYMTEQAAAIIQRAIDGALAEEALGHDQTAQALADANRCWREANKRADELDTALAQAKADLMTASGRASYIHGLLNSQTDLQTDAKFEELGRALKVAFENAHAVLTAHKAAASGE